MLRRCARPIIRFIYTNTPRKISRLIVELLPESLEKQLKTLFHGDVAELEAAARETIHRELHSVRHFDVALDTMAENRLGHLPLVRPAIVENVHRLLISMLSQLEGQTRFIVFAGHLTLGGAEYYAASIYRSLVRSYGRDAVAFVVTDSSASQAVHWLGDNPNLIFMNDLQPKLDEDSRSTILKNVIAALRPEAIFNVNSECVWRMLCSAGMSIQRMTKIYSALFGYELLENGSRIGYARTHFRDSVEFHDGVLFDNDTFRKQVAIDLALPASITGRLTTVFAPVDPSWLLPNSFPDGPGRTRRVLWAGRFVFSKQPLLALEVARRLPSFQFDFFGGGSSIRLVRKMRRSAPANVAFKGAFNQLGSLPISDYDALLYTSVTDGIPTILLEAGTANLPVVATAVGGIPEVINESTGWLVVARDDPDAYAEKLKACMCDRQAAMIKAEKFRRLLSERHDEKLFDATVARLLNAEA